MLGWSYSLISLSGSSKPNNIPLFIAGVSQVCYSQPGCVGDIVTAPGPTARDCCAGTDGGKSFSENGVNCTVSQCRGMHNTIVGFHMATLD